MHTFIRYTFLITLLLVFFACEKKAAEGPAEPGDMLIEFDNIALVNGVQQQLSLVGTGNTNYIYKNALEQNFNITLLRYYISNIKLEGPNGEMFVDPVKVEASGTTGVYLVNESDPASGNILLENLPAGTYNKITFTVGVEANAVQEGAAGGVLDPATSKMFWNWNSGYIALKFEGQAAVSNGGVTGGETLPTGTPNGIAYHVGGWRDVEGTAFVNNNKTLSFYFDTDASVQDGTQPTVHMVFDVLRLFSGQNTIDFTGNHNVHKPIDGRPLADNIPAAFSFDHVHQ